MKRNIPNIITSCNLISGCIATCYAFYGDASLALLWIVIGAVFDFFDGMSARLLKVSSPIGKELDSLADDVTFGVAPATIIFAELMVLDYPAFLEPFRNVIPFFAFILAAFSALRLAKFNLDERQSMGFIGLPTPANALFWGSLIVGYQNILESNKYIILVLLAMICLSCWFLIAEIPMFALKFKHWGINHQDNIVKYCFILFSAVILAVFNVAGIAIVILAYITVSIILDAIKK
ncbi:MAG: CDP-alcohol phosphatidyltransferase family protein [Bacteroidales bacterium]|nr:CDP-alcohol phosphatidyltransferase family protein [Bacteroidales bacterium]MCM1147444.1 CDP-alcohol phosphatidyltransferase family protein [Bacteroidales bacterium]MCM1206113.1 CDP-alcohol phosphatidyltransferase family protein [Bacillota bacterium]MCM1510056.1 CDP-alcohol phosphatidyltransferase family protein [Clostridium sp.]